MRLAEQIGARMRDLALDGLRAALAASRWHPELAIIGAPLAGAALLLAKVIEPGGPRDLVKSRLRTLALLVLGALLHALFPHATAASGAYSMIGMGAAVAGLNRALSTVLRATDVGRTVPALPADADLQHALELMDREDVDALPVIDPASGDAPYGLLTRTAIRCFLSRGRAALHAAGVHAVAATELEE
jgi:CBS domain-containing protein